MKKFLIILFAGLLLPFSVWAEEPITSANEFIRPLVRILNAENFQLEKDFFPFDQDSKSEGLNLATADLNNDGYKEIIVATGRNEKPLVKIFNYQGVLLSEFLAYEETFKNGFKVSAADLFNDGNTEIITVPNQGYLPKVSIFKSNGQPYFSFLAFAEKYKGGLSLAAGDINNDNQKEIIVGSGKEMEPVVRIFDNYGNFIIEFYAYEKTFKNGVNVLVADLNNDKKAEIITAPAFGKEAKINIFSATGLLINQFLAYPAGFYGGVNLAAGDVDLDGNLEIITGPGFGGGAHLRIFNAKGEVKNKIESFVFKDFKGGLAVADGDIDKDAKSEIVIGTQYISPTNKYSAYKIIEIDLTKQKLYTYKLGSLENEYIISSGKRKFPTPEGNFKINYKVLKTNMARDFGPNNPENYNLPNVPNVMYFYRDYAIHGAYWHWKFGTRVSHGCINLKLKDAKEVYNWADVGIPVNIYSSKK